MHEKQIRLIKSYLTQRKFVFEVEGKKSKPFNLKTGCAAGSCLGPILWIIFINDLPKAVKDSILSVLFADDCAEVAAEKELEKVKKEIKLAAREIHKWSVENGLVLSVPKTKVMWLNTKQEPEIFIDGTPLENVSKFKYLGHVIDKKLTGEQHLQKIEERVHKIIGLIKKSSFEISLESLSQMSHTYAFPLCLYGWEAILPLMTAKNTKKWHSLLLQVQKASLALHFNTQTEIVEKISKVPSFQDFINKQHTKHVRRLAFERFPKNNLKTILAVKKPNSEKKTRNTNYCTIEQRHEKSDLHYIIQAYNDLKLPPIPENEEEYKNELIVRAEKISKMPQRPKMTVPVIAKNLTISERKAIMKCAAGTLTKLHLAKSNPEISKYCDCGKTENLNHLINCGLNGDKNLSKVVNPVLKQMTDYVQKRLHATKNPYMKEKCIKLLNYKVHSFRYLDFLLGIGQIQILKEINCKLWKKLSEKIMAFQLEFVIPQLKNKNRIGEYYQVFEALRDRE